jgi:ADP-ribose pyrophosphatase YjhB (NUDIX family)
MRERAAVVIIKEGRVLLIYRKKNGREYYIVPGGGVEEGETPEVACLREAMEETSLHVQIDRKMTTTTDPQQTTHYFLVSDFSGEPALGGPEQQRNSETNVYILEWIDQDRLETINLLPPDARQICLEALAMTK